MIRPGPALRRLALKVDLAIGTFAEAAGARWCWPKSCILFAGVVSRYVFDSPLMWTDELANFLFLWLAMLGTVVALRRDGHMRLTTFVNSVSPERGRWLGDRRRPRRHRLRPRDPAAGRAISRRPALDRADHAADLRRLAGRWRSWSAPPCWRSSPCCACSKPRAGAALRWRSRWSARSPSRCGWRSRC